MTLNDLFNKMTNFKIKMKGVEEIMVSNMPLYFRVGRKLYKPEDVEIKVLIDFDEKIEEPFNVVNIELMGYIEEE